MLVHSSYGKNRVRLTKVNRLLDRHELIEIDVDMQLSGDFDESYLSGDNSKVVATDSMKNTVYVLARNHAIESIESFALDLARHFLARYPQVHHSTIDISARSWHRIDVDGKPHPTAFLQGSSETRTCLAHITREGKEFVKGGLQDLVVLKTTDSAFKGFVRDKFTTLPDAEDRIFATSVGATWDYVNSEVDWNRCFAHIREALLQTFATHHSLAVQQTLYDMGQAALVACPEVEMISLEMPNQHRILVNLQPFGLDNPNVVFVSTSEPFGLITGMVVREEPDED